VGVVGVTGVVVGALAGGLVVVTDPLERGTVVVGDVDGASVVLEEPPPFPPTGCPATELPFSVVVE
jgi:hypothetical protein